MELLHHSYFGNNLLHYIIAATIILGGFLVLAIVSHFLKKSLFAWTARTPNHLDDFVVDALWRAAVPLAYYAVVYFALRSLQLNPAMDKALTAAGTVLFTIIAVRFILQAFQYFVFEVYMVRHVEAGALQRQAKALMPIMTVVVWSLGVIFLLDNLGFKISTLVAGLGIGGVALALASQTILGDLFSYFAIMMDRPFEIDDFIVSNDFMGSVERIGIKTTRLRSLGGEQLVFPNKDLTDSRLRNYKRMELRRVEFNLNLSYETPSNKIERAISVVRDLITHTPGTRLDRVHFFAFGEYQLVLQTAYFVLSADYNVYMDVQQKINLGIKEGFEREGISFGFPIRRLLAQEQTAELMHR